MDRERLIVDAIARFWDNLQKYMVANDLYGSKRPYGSIIAQWLNEFHGYFVGRPTSTEEVEEALYSDWAHRYLWVNATRTIVYVDGIREAFQ